MNKIHFSVDDTIGIFEDITKNKSYESIFNNPLLRSFYNLHEEYGLKLSLYCFYENGNKTFNLSMCTDRFSEEFNKNSGWLKLGFHGKNENSKYAKDMFGTLKRDYSLVTDELIRISSIDCIDTCPRLSYCTGDEEGIVALKNHVPGIEGLLCADDTRLEYYLPADKNEELIRTGKYKDEKNGLTFFLSEKRFELMPDLDEYLASKDFKSKITDNRHFEFFSHEYCFSKSPIGLQLTTLCKYAKTNGLEFSFPKESI
ncbi:MAG: hypothetical protein Q8882_00600 [Bacillota bacterium]|nr:hypothetical protein [Bacillota bacterium]